MILSTSDCSRKSHPRSSPTDTQSVKSMLDHLSSTKADPALTSRLTLSLKQLKARTTTIQEVLQAFPTLPWQQVSEDSAFIKRPKLEPVVIIDEIEDMDQVVVVETVKVLAVNEACIAKRWGKGTFSKRSGSIRPSPCRSSSSNKVFQRSSYRVSRHSFDSSTVISPASYLRAKCQVTRKL